MIVFDKLWKTMKKKNISQYKLIREYGFSRGQLDRIKSNHNINTFTINQLCNILNCKISDIATFIPDKK